MATDVNIGPQMMAVLSRYGLEELATWLSERITAGASADQITLELYDQPRFKAAFPEIEAREQLIAGKGVILAPLSPDQIITLRNSYRTLMRQYGLPASFYDNKADFYTLVVNDVSPEELQQRLDTAVTRVQMAPPEVRAAFGEWFGAAGDNALFQIFVDVDRALPSLEEMTRTAEAGGAARRFGFSLMQSEAERVARAGITYSQATEGFSSLDELRTLFDETLFEEEDFTVGEEGIEAVFGLEGGATRKLEERAKTRTAQTQGESGGIITEVGPTSLGGAGRR